MERKALTQPAAIPLGMGKGHTAGAKGGCLPGTGLCKKKTQRRVSCGKTSGKTKGLGSWLHVTLAPWSGRGLYKGGSQRRPRVKLARGTAGPASPPHAMEGARDDDKRSDGRGWGLLGGCPRVRAGGFSPRTQGREEKAGPVSPAPPKEMGRGDAAKMDGAPQNGWWESTAAPSPPPGQGTWP